jgi:hypothetical protein
MFNLAAKIKNVIGVVIMLMLVGCAGGGSVNYKTTSLLPLDASVGIVYNSDHARKLDEVVCRQLTDIQKAREEAALKKGEPLKGGAVVCTPTEVGHELVMANFLKEGSVRRGATQVTVVDGENIPAEVDYLVYLQNLKIGCKTASESAGTIASGAILVGVTTAFLPVSFGYTAYNTASTDFVVIKRENEEQFATGKAARTGGRLVASCDNILNAIADGWAAKQFVKPEKK